MRVFILSCAAALVLAVTAHTVLNAFQVSIADAYVTSSARLNDQEAVNFIGREG